MGLVPLQNQKKKKTFKKTSQNVTYSYIHVQINMHVHEGYTHFPNK